MLADSLGNPVRLADPASLGALNDFVEGFISCEARVANILQVAQTDHSAIVQAACAALHMFAESADAPGNAAPFISMALQQAPPPPNASNASWLPWQPGCRATWRAPSRCTKNRPALHPRDLASLKLGQYHLFNRGDSPGMLRLALAALPAAGDVPYLHGMAAFAWEQCHLMPQAENAPHARRWPCATRSRGHNTRWRMSC